MSHPLLPGIDLLQKGRPAEAEAFFRNLLRDLPDDGNVLHLLGIACGDQGRHGEAVALLRRATDIVSNAPAMHFNLGRALEAAGDTAGAVDCFCETLRQDPDFNPARVRLAALDPTAASRLSGQGNPIPAPPPEDAHSLQGMSAAGAFEAFSESLAKDPGQSRLHSKLLANLQYLPASDPGREFQAHQSWGRALSRHLGCEALAPAQRPARDRPLRIGYVSPDLRMHSVAFFLEPLLAHHDPSVVEVHAYSDVPIGDEVTLRLRSLVPHWHATHALDDDALAAAIRQDGIDILVDLAGHTTGNRLPVFARRPAPLQVSWLGYPGSTGLEAIAARIVTEAVEPPGSEQPSSERVFRLPTGFHCYRPPAEAPEPGPLPWLTHGHVTFGSFNNFIKLNQESLLPWAAILRALPGSRLLLKDSTPRAAALGEDLRDFFAEEGILPGRILILPRTADLAEHLAAYQRVDIALDPVTYNGVTTTCEALWMGVPVVTLRGDRHARRVAASLLGQVGLDRLVADTPRGYVDRALALATDIESLGTLRAGLRNRVAASPLMDEPGFARRMESAYLSLWQSPAGA